MHGYKIDMIRKYSLLKQKFLITNIKFLIKFQNINDK